MSQKKEGLRYMRRRIYACHMRRIHAIGSCHRRKKAFPPRPTPRFSSYFGHRQRDLGRDIYAQTRETVRIVCHMSCPASTSFMLIASLVVSACVDQGLQHQSFFFTLRILCFSASTHISVRLWTLDEGAVKGFPGMIV
jgi:hypothetical protein